ncbi:MAG TPA: LuxR C-terminal-related transcriptional regulator [Dehalococcoidia bacterium]|nr:LuxR C-terminal-related transcriptional regulator [Dehalococcoidia bacterium]
MEPSAQAAAVNQAALPDRVHEPLTPRERDVTRLLAKGYSDRQIASALAIAVRTVGVHVHHILDKLDLRSRWQVADWAAEHANQEAAGSGHEHGRPRSTPMPAHVHAVAGSGTQQRRAGSRYARTLCQEDGRPT